VELKSLIPFGRSGDPARTSNLDPFAAMRRDMERMMNDTWRGFLTPREAAPSALAAPRMDVAESDAGLTIKVELPGIDPKNVDLSIADGVLTLKAEQSKEREEKDEAKRYHLVERSHGAYMRRLALPFDPDEDKMSATFANGLLTIDVPRSGDAMQKTRKIPVRSA
jgi:HSP20 family protein